MKNVDMIREVYQLMSVLIWLDDHDGDTVKNLNIDNIIFSCLAAIHVLLRDPFQRTQLMAKSPFDKIRSLAGLLTRPNILLQREAIGSLCELMQVGLNNLIPRKLF